MSHDDTFFCLNKLSLSMAHLLALAFQSLLTCKQNFLLVFVTFVPMILFVLNGAKDRKAVLADF